MTIEEAREYFSQDRFAMKTTGITIDEVGDNYSKCSLTVEEKHLGAKDHVMGGAIYTLADFSFAVASNTPDKFTMTLNSTINYMRQPKDNRLIATCSCTKDGRKACFFYTEITDGQGNVIATVNATGMHI